jgi:probable phosphomutase (TIGR03848 family)
MTQMPTRRSARPAVAILVRHGRTPTTGSILPGRAPGLHLSDAGRAQAETAAQRIAALRPAPVAVYTSPLERAAETAKPIAAHLGVRARVERGLLECDFGTWTGQELRKLRRRREWRTVQQLPSAFRFPEGESFAQMQARMTDTLDRLSERHRGQSFVAVSHADTIRAAVAGTAGVPLDLFQRVVVSPCSITVVARSESGYRILTVNSTPELGDLGLS